MIAYFTADRGKSGFGAGDPLDCDPGL